MRVKDTELDIDILLPKQITGCPVCDNDHLTFTLIECNIGSVSKYQGYLWRGHCKNCRKITVLVPRR